MMGMLYVGTDSSVMHLEHVLQPGAAWCRICSKFQGTAVRPHL